MREPRIDLRTTRRAPKNPSQAQSLLLTVMVALTSLSCALFEPKIEYEKPTTGTTFGAILVDTPEVYGRERLVQDRQRQRKWLQEQLETSDSSFDTFEALFQHRAAATQGFDLGVDATATARDAVGQLDDAAATRARNLELEELRHEIERARLQQELQAVLAGEATLQTSSAGSDASKKDDDSKKQDGSDDGKAKDSAKKEGEGGGDKKPDGNSGPVLPKLAMAGNQATDSPINRFRRKLAYREIVRQELLENDLDDAHDLATNTLYRFTFDTTIVPEHDTSAWAVVTAEVAAPTTCADVRTGDTPATMLKLMEEWLRSFETFLREEATDFALTLAAEHPGPEALPLLTVHQQYDQPEKDAGREAELVVLEYYQTLAADRGLPIDWKSEPAPSLRGATTDAIALGVDLQGATANERLRAFCTLLEHLPGEPSSYAVTPKETVQRLAEASAGTSDRQLALALGATLGTVGVKQAFEAGRIEEVQQQSIRRQPLVVGFANPENDNVGWVIGPRFKARLNGFDFRHTLVQEPLSALISVPAWWPEALITVRTCWALDESADARPGWITPTTLCPRLGTPEQHTVSLPASVTRITEALFHRARRPRPFFYGTPKLQIDREEQLLVFGRNLWRSPIVYLANQRADSVDILPNMEAIVATFDKVRKPPGFTKSGTYDVTVFTSEGVGFAGSVELVAGAEKKNPTSTAPKALFSITATTDHIVATGGKGTVNLELEIEGKTVDKVYLKVADADFDRAATSPTPATCLASPTLHLWEVSKDCLLVLGLKNLKADGKVTIEAYRKEGTKKISHADLVFDVSGT